jgi:hypothetical protein
VRAPLVIVAIAAAVACVAAVNLVLLGYGNNRHDPVGRLNPVTSLPGAAHVRPQENQPEHGDERDD